ncbi:hypothetical protein [Absidia glauca]|uniref:Uncharacterized protein n=1 Tax=Absidia glauca TaxID=4829 RepID=A0A168LLY3_ABSGL|nr:hypothetical protein [Absidia glauca]
MAPHIDTLPPVPLQNFKDVVFTWEQVYHYVSTNQIKKIHRHPTTQVVYNKWIKETLDTYGTIEHYLLSTKLKPFTTSNPPTVIVLPNDFPYSVEKGIQHVLIWSQEPLAPTFVDTVLGEQYDPGVWEWVYWVNPPEIQSVKKLPHVHVFLRKRPV